MHYFYDAILIAKIFNAVHGAHIVALLKDGLTTWAQLEMVRFQIAILKLSVKLYLCLFFKMCRLCSF